MNVKKELAICLRFAVLGISGAAVGGAAMGGAATSGAGAKRVNEAQPTDAAGNGMHDGTAACWHSSGKRSGCFWLTQ